MIDAALQSIEAILAYLDTRPGIWVVLIGLIGGLCTGMAYKKTVIRAVQAATGSNGLSDRCADAHAVLIQLASGVVSFVLVFALWPHRGGWAVALIVALSCGLTYDTLRALIAWRWPAFARRLGLPRSDA